MMAKQLHALLVSFALCLVPLLLSGCENDKSEPEAAATNNTAREMLDKAVEEAAANITGLGEFSILVGDAQGILYAKKGTEVDAHGFAPSSFTKPQRVFSASKWITAAALGAAVKANVFAWDDPVGKYITWWTKDPEDHRVNMTFAHCLSHTSGLITSQYMARLWGLQDYIPNADVALSNEGYTLESSARLVFDNTAADIPKPPGSWKYGEVHYLVAQFAALQASGMNTWQDFFAKYFGTPLGLQREIEDPEHLTTKAYFSSGNPYAYGFHFGPGRRTETSHSNNPDGGGAVVISPCAYSRFLVSYLSNGEMWNANEVDEVRTDTGMSALGGGAKYAFGHWVVDGGPLNGAGHSIGNGGSTPMVIPGDKPFWIYVSRFTYGGSSASIELLASLISDIQQFMGSSPVVDNSVCPS